MQNRAKPTSIKWYTIAAEIWVTIKWTPATMQHNGRRQLPPFYRLSLLASETFRGGWEQVSVGGFG